MTVDSQPTPEQPRDSHTYQHFGHKQQQLLKIIRNQAAVLRKLKLESRIKTVETLEEVVRNDTFKVLVLGQFKTGKSTFINALLREEILPADPVPCTAIINEIRYTEDSAYAMLYTKAPQPDEENPRKIAVDRLKDFVVIQDTHDTNVGRQVRESPYEKVELFWPLSMLHGGQVEIIDSPGLNENQVREDVTLSYLGTVDAILFVVSALQLGPSIYEEKAIQNLKDAGHEDIFFICNRFDALRKKERERVQEHGLAVLGPHTKHGRKRVFFISSLQALDGYLEDDPELVEQSGIKPLIESLDQFLVYDRGRIKLMRAARELQSTVREGLQAIPEIIAMLQTDQKTLEERYDSAQEPLRRLDQDRRSIVNRIDQARSDIRDLVNQRTLGFYRTMANEIDTWISEYEIQAPVAAHEIFKVQSAIERVIQEIVDHLAERLQDEFETWQRQELQPFLVSRLEALKDDLDERAKNFITQIDQVRLEISTGTSEAIHVEGVKSSTSALERVLAAAGGFLIGGIGSAGIGLTFGYQEMLKSLLPQIAVGVATILLVGFNPWILIPTLLAAGTAHGWMKLRDTNNKIKEEVGRKFAIQIREKSAEEAALLAHQIHEKLSGIRNTIDKGLTVEIMQVRKQVEEVLSEKQRGDASVKQRLNELDEVRKEINQVALDLENFIFDVAST
jgi:GTP-binding protein EngB required for normal cell division